MDSTTLFILFKVFIGLLAGAFLYLVYVFGYLFFVKPYFGVKYYLRQKGNGHFTYGPKFFTDCYEDTLKHGNGLHRYYDALKKDPSIKFFVRSIGKKPLVFLVDTEMAKAFLQNHQDFPKPATTSELVKG